MADETERPEETTGEVKATRSLADPEIAATADARAKEADISNLDAGLMSKDRDAKGDMTPAKMVDYYKDKMRTGDVGVSRTGMATRIRADLTASGDKAPTDERVNGIVDKIFGR